MRQSINVPLRLPPWLLATGFLLVVVSSTTAQERYRVTRAENFRREPGPSGRLLAQLEDGAEAAGTDRRDGWVQITLEGWIWSASIETSATGEYDVEVMPARGENLRVTPNGTVLGRLGRGVLLELVEDTGEWSRVRRQGWIWGQSVQQIGGAAPPPNTSPPPVQSAPSPAATTANRVTSEYSVTGRSASLHLVPGSDSTGYLAQDTPVRLLERRAGWVKVAVEAWVVEDAVRPTSADVLVGVSGAEVRARPAEFEGKVVQWIVQYIALRTADDLRAELPAGQQYLLVRGPIPEAGFAYVIVNSAQADVFRDVSPLAHLVIDARVVVSRSRYLSNTVLELQNFSIRNP